MPAASIYFWGSILESSSFLQQGPQDKKRTFTELPFSSSRETQIRFDDPAWSSQRGIVNPDELVELDHARQGNPVFSDLVPAVTSSQKREIIFQPPLPKHPEWRQQKIRADQAVFKIYISAEGLVEEVLNSESSSHPEIDAALARYLSRWRFAPAASQKGQWQTVRIGLRR